MHLGSASKGVGLVRKLLLAFATALLTTGCWVRRAFAPENDLFPIIGLTSIICPDLIGTQEEGWGAIKFLYE
jgi:hypothetical protein